MPPRNVAGSLLSHRPRVRLFDAFATGAECSALRRLAARRLSACIAEDGGRGHERSSSGCWLPRLDAPDFAWAALGASASERRTAGAVERRIADATRIAHACGEPAQVLRYRPGERYALHPDFFSPDDMAELANGGQRRATFLLYLNDVPAGAGGATAWPDAAPPLRVQPRMGQAVLWHNCRPDGRIDERSVHAGERVAAPHEKWVLSKFLRERPFVVDDEAFRLRGRRAAKR